MKRKMKNRVLAGSMAAVMTAALAGTCGYQNVLLANAEENDAASNDKASDEKVDEQAKEAETKELEETIQGLLKDSDASDKGTFCKEESVYIKADATGKVKSTTVTEWLKNPGTGTTADYTELKNVTNIKGEESFSQNGNEINWEAKGKDIYYQGTTEKEAPVGVEITYMLDGKEISPEELKGKDGHLDITFHYLNNSVEKVESNGETVEMYTPFTMVTAMMLPVEEYQNVSVDHGKIISDAEHDIVVGVGFPGMDANLNLEDKDLELSDSVTVSADVTDFEVHPSLTIASTEILDQFDLTDAQDFDSLEDSIHKLEDAANELTKGSSDASDGAKALSDGTHTLCDGAETLSDGAKTLSDGIHTLDAKSADLIEGVRQLTEGVAAYTGGVDTLAQGSTVLAEGASSVNDGAAQIKSGVQTAKAGADQLVAGYDDPAAGAVVAAQGIAGGLGQLSQALGAQTDVELSEEQIAGVNQLAAGMAAKAVEAIPDEVFAQMGITKEAYIGQLTAGYAQILLPQITAAVNDAANAVKGQVKGNVDQIAEVSNALALGVGQLRDGTVALQSGLAALDQGSTALAAGTGQLLQGASELAAGAGTLQSNSGALRSGTGQLSDGGALLTDGVTQLAAGADQLSGGAEQLSGGAKELSDGAGKLSDGNKKLADGMAQFKEEGIEKLVNVFDGDIKDVTSRMESMIDLGRAYKSFTGIKDGVEGTTKFIIECE